jgi:hypothetical protein
MCAYAIRIGLPRLAEDEEAIDPADVLPLAPLEPDSEQSSMADLFEDRPGAIEPAAGLAQLAIERGMVPYRVGDVTTLWISYHIEEVVSFDAIVFESELEALRYAVEHGEKVHRLELGRSLREQVAE